MCQGLFFNKVAACNYIEKEATTQMFLYEFCETFKSTRS